MSNRKFICQSLVLILVALFCACDPEEEGDKIAPYLMTSSPADDATSVDTGTVITLQFTEKINLSPSAQISLNEEVVSASAEHKELTIEAVLQQDTEYILVIPANSIYDDAGNFTGEISIHFTTASSPANEATIYEAELAILSGGAVVSTAVAGYSGTGYVSSNEGNISFSVHADNDGYYDIDLRYNTSGLKKENDLYVDGSKIASLVFSATTQWKTMSAGKIKLTAGDHSIAIVKTWGWTLIDFMSLAFDSDGLDPFNIATSLVATNPSVEAVKVYNYLKTNFGTNVISGTMANYSTNIDEATWVFNQTGKWPALTCFDFIDHTYPNQNWVKYTAPLTLGQDWWSNNGLVALMWHWRDPLTKSGSFYTAETTFNISRIADTTSVEYKAIIVDIDVIAGYLKQFRDANIPVIWRPLHEAAGTWFWWGAKGPTHCKTLWKLIFNRFTKMHGLNNLIWVWTTDVGDDALDWYPGDEYVDILGMDIYPGENQHGSQYFSFNKVKELFGGRKMITLSECGSVPDPSRMSLYGDMWSWFMPWNGDLNRSVNNNGPAWWNQYFSYDFVLTRDKMPNLK